MPYLFRRSPNSVDRGYEAINDLSWTAFMALVAFLTRAMICTVAYSKTQPAALLAL